MNFAQSVHDALDRDASQRPAAEREVEPLARHVQRLRIVDGEAHALLVLRRDRGARCADRIAAGIECVHRRRVAGGETSEPASAAADFDDPLAGEIDNLGDSRGLDPLAITAVPSTLQARAGPAAHPRFTARIVDPIAPYFFAL